VEALDGASEIREFVRFHDRVYGSRGVFWPASSPPEIAFVSGLGPMAEGRRYRPFVARRGDEIVARVLALLDDRYNRHWGERLGHAIKFEALPGTRGAVRAVMDAACEWLAANGADAVRCGTGLQDAPFVIDDYTSLPASVARYNPPYYHALLKDAG